MPIHLFNPATPHNDPVEGYLDQASGGECGNCPCIAHAWKVSGISAATPGGAPGSSGSGNFFITDFKGDGTTNGVSSASDNFVTVLVAWLPTADAWWQFLSVPIPPGARITSATLTLTLNAAPQSAQDLYYKLTGSPSSAQAEPTGPGWSSLPRTASQVTGFVPGGSLANQALTFDVSGIVQEIVNGTWAANGSLMFFMEGQSPPGGGGGTGVAWKALDSNANLPFTQTSLSVSWTAINSADYVGLFMGDHILLRDQLDDFVESTTQGCTFSCSIRLDPIASSFAFAGSIELDGSGAEGIATAQDWFLYLRGLPNIGVLPADVCVYKLNRFIGPDQRPFRCLGPNTFYREDLLGSGNFPVPGMPDSLLVQPFWP